MTSNKDIEERNKERVDDPMKDPEYQHPFKCEWCGKYYQTGYSREFCTQAHENLWVQMDKRSEMWLESLPPEATEPELEVWDTLHDEWTKDMMKDWRKLQAIRNGDTERF